MYKGYLIDLDGTAYNGTDVIPETIEFTNELIKKEIPFLFVTNNSSATELDVVDKLNNMGYNTTVNNILTTAYATAKYISLNIKNAKVLMIGSSGLYSALKNESIEITDDYSIANTVVIGLDKKVDYDKFSDACLAIRNGAHFISTNPDIAIPTEIGFLPGNGALTKLVEHSTGESPLYIGKPNEYIMQTALDKLNLTASEVCMIGDNYNTDILAGINMNIDTIYVQTGLTTLNEIKNKTKKPTHICKNLLEFVNKI